MLSESKEVDPAGKAVDKLGDFLEELKAHLNLDPKTERRVMREIATYFHDKIEDLKSLGLSEKDAVSQAIESFGRARDIARQTYYTYGRGKAIDVMLAALPHLIVSSVFAVHGWRSFPVVIGLLAFFVSVTLFGWWIGRPRWIYTWIGYSMLPLLISSYLMFPALRRSAAMTFTFGFLRGPAGVFLGTSSFFVVALVIFVFASVRIVRRDWMLASLALVHFPIFAGWLIALEPAGLFSDNQEAMAADLPMAATLFVLALSSAAFVRLRSRAMKIGALATVDIIAMVIFAYVATGEIGFLKLITIVVCMLAFLFAPAAADAFIEHTHKRKEARTTCSGSKLA